MAPTIAADVKGLNAVLHIGVESGDLLRPHRAGMARYTHCLLTALTQRLLVSDVHAWAPRRRLLGAFKSPPGTPLHFFGHHPPRRRPDIFHATANVFPVWKSAVEIATVHDLYAVREELSLSSQDIRQRTEYIHRADRIICVSHYTRDHLHRVLDIPQHRTQAIPLAVESRFAPASSAEKILLRRKYGLPSSFLLFVGRYRANKNLPRLFAALRASGLDISLYIAGCSSKREQQQLMQIATEHQCEQAIGWLGEVKEKELPALLSCATALCLPSTFEGFGLPIIEAMACGTAVMTSAGRATEEVAGGHAILVDPESIESIADGLHRVLHVSAAQRDAARLFARRRSWDDVAAETWQLYANACAVDHQYFWRAATKEMSTEIQTDA